MGLTILDAGAVIAILDAGGAHHAVALRALADARDRGDDLPGRGQVPSSRGSMPWTDRRVAGSDPVWCYPAERKGPLLTKRALVG